jgi:hypothetical protein
MPPLGCLPFTRALKAGNTGTCLDGMTALAKLHNKALPKVLQKLERQLNGFRYSIADGYTAFSERINNPSKYGMSCPFLSYQINLFMISIFFLSFFYIDSNVKD